MWTAMAKQFETLTATEPAPDPEAVEYWGKFILPGGAKGESKMARLIGAIYDFVRNTTYDPPPRMQESTAYSYITPSMMVDTLDLFDYDHFRFSAEEKGQIDLHILDKLFKVYYDSIGTKYITCTRPNGPEDGMPLIERFDLFFNLSLYILAAPDSMHRKFNAILAKPDHVFIDLFTEAPFEYLVIPRSAFPDEADAKFKPDYDSTSKDWREIRTRTLQELLPKAAATTQPEYRKLSLPPSTVLRPLQKYNPKASASATATPQPMDPSLTLEFDSAIENMGRAIHGTSATSSENTSTPPPTQPSLDLESASSQETVSVLIARRSEMSRIPLTPQQTESAAQRLSRLTGLSSTPSAPPQQPPSAAIINRVQAPPPAPRIINEAALMMQLQAFEPYPGEPEAASRARFHALLEGVDEATMGRLLVQGRRLENQSMMNAASAAARAQAQIARANDDYWRSLDIAHGYHWDYKYVRR